MDLPTGWTTGTVRANGVDLHYYRTGAGSPIVLAHGFTDNGRCWEPLASDLRSEYDLIMYDARGHGRSDAPDSGYGIDDRVADLVGLVRALSLEDPILLGHSMGGSTAAATAAAHPDLPRALVLEDPAGLLDRDADDEGADGRERARDVREQVREWHDRSVADIAAEYDQYDPRLARLLAIARTECSPEIAAIARAGYPDPRTVYGDVVRPTLVLKADADPRSRADHLAVADRLADGRLVHVPDAGHCVFRDRYEPAVAELRAFLRRV